MTAAGTRPRWSWPIYQGPCDALTFAVGLLIRFHDNWVQVKDKLKNQSRVLGAVSTQQRIHLIVSESIRMHSGGTTRIMALCDTERGVNTWATS